MAEENKNNLVQTFFEGQLSPNYPLDQPSSSEYADTEIVEGQLVNIEMKNDGYDSLRKQTLPYRFKEGVYDPSRSKGGKNSHRDYARRKKNKQLVLSMIQCKPDITPSMLASLKKLGIYEDDDGYTIEVIATAAMLQKAMKGDLKAYEMMLSIIGQKPVQEVVVQTDPSVSAALENALFGENTQKIEGE